uniref:CSON005194 protein n=1 Tax=Culicoides sonorensis TaxID=179676 RepID=A0A336L5G1_CULSO
MILAQDYDVTSIQCSFASQNPLAGDFISAKLTKPVGFKGSPIFADDRGVDPELDPFCRIKPDRNDPTDLNYDLRITDFSRCGVLKRNGFVHVRIWFPQFPSVVMQSDQELIIMCKPPEPTVIQNKAAGFAGSFPHGARVSGVVEETPGRLEYEVALYKEAPPLARVSGINDKPHRTNSTTIAPHHLKNDEVPVDQAVPIGTKLQLRARISSASVWKYVKLMEVTVSPDPEDPHARGAVSLVRDGCRNRDFASIIPHQPARYRDRPNEVFLDFEAFLLSSMKERSTLWIHSQIKACMDASDCQPDFCLDLYEPTGNNKRHGRRRRTADQNATDYTRFKENIAYSVIMPGENDSGPMSIKQSMEQCKNVVGISGVLAALLALSTIITCRLASKLYKAKKPFNDHHHIKPTTAHIHHSHYNQRSRCSGYAGRAIVQ